MLPGKGGGTDDAVANTEVSMEDVRIILQYGEANDLVGPPLLLFLGCVKNTTIA